MSPVVVDSNLLLLLIVGSASPNYIAIHKNLSSHYTVDDYELLTEVIGRFYSDIVLLPHITAEVSNLARQIRNPAKKHILAELAALVEATAEIHLPSLVGVRRTEFAELGLTDSVILHLCALEQTGVRVALLTADTDLAVRAEILEYDVLNFSHLR